MLDVTPAGPREPFLSGQTVQHGIAESKPPLVPAVLRQGPVRDREERRASVVLKDATDAPGEQASALFFSGTTS